jgi:hypothetical protein
MNAPKTRQFFDVAPRCHPHRSSWTALALFVVLVQFLDVHPVSAQATDVSTAVHFLEQATFGPTAVDVANVQAMASTATPCVLRSTCTWRTDPTSCASAPSSR